MPPVFSVGAAKLARLPTIRRAMIAFGTAITDVKAYDRYAVPGIERAREPDSKVFAHQGTGSLFRNYNLIIDMARKIDDLEAVALVHQDAEIVDDEFCGKI